MKSFKMRWLLFVVVGLFVPLLTVMAGESPKKEPGPTTEKRVALIIGNGAYIGENLSPLDNPTNDAEDIAKILKEFGFDVKVYKNLKKPAMDEAIAEFGRRASNADASLFYFAGHGLQIKSQNYLMPIDAAAKSEASIGYEGINVNFVLDELENAHSNVNMVLLDACRNNAFSGKFRGGKTRGLAVPDSTPKGTVLVYATDPGNVAADGEGRNGLFTEGLLSGFRSGDLSLDGVLATASLYVEEKSNKQQTPYVNGPQTVMKRFKFQAGGTTQAGSPLATTSIANTGAPADRESIFWQSTQGDPELCKEYLRKWPKGVYVLPAKRCVDKVKLDLLAAKNEVEKKKLEKADTQQLQSELTPNPETFRSSKAKPVYGMEFVKVAGGSFPMGCGSWQSDCQEDENPVHEVRVDGFEIGKHEVTQGVWKEVMESNPSHFASCGKNCPVEQTSWEDTQDFIAKLNGLKDGCTYRLPTEAEWEYACRSGGKEEKNCGEGEMDQVAWNNENSSKEIHPVAQKQANGLGLFDMSGNVWEWVSDWYGEDFYARSSKDNPQGPEGGTGRVNRGGSWDDKPTYIRSSNRDRNDPGVRNRFLGFRLARNCH
ncbi:MAG: hypothetical protein HW380_336 [Magnetococcales bacterium]|nr:hypothetical protein [Magnetococcales bacterium]HIJ83006.1 SUMF1/EgtB/PvdO family nonheme iron enzyme [Magnetococcales bacterium]